MPSASWPESELRKLLMAHSVLYHLFSEHPIPSQRAYRHTHQDLHLLWATPPPP